MRPRLRLVAGLALVLLAPGLAIAYGTRIHALLPRYALADRVHDTLPGITDRDLVEFRVFLYRTATSISDLEIRRSFLARYPDAASFDARGMREFLMMNGAARVLGVDPFEEIAPPPSYVPGSRLPRLGALELGSVSPDLDRRNQDRLLRAPDGTPKRSAHGDSVPFDPMTLNMGALTGLSSQAHAHYALNRHPKSSDPRVLRYAPWDFAIATSWPGEVETYAPDNAQLYTDLALLAAHDGKPSGPLLGAIFAGTAAHYIADAGNAIHTVQVGIYPIFVDATVQHWLRNAGRLFGLFGTAPSRNAIGLGIITNLHTMSERLFEVEVSSGTVGLPRIDDSLAVMLDDTVLVLRRSSGAPDFARAITASLADAGNRDGAEVYRITREMVARDLRLGKVTVDFDTVPDADLRHWLKDDAAAASRLREFNALEARGLARTGSALRAWWAEYARELTYRTSRENLIDFVATRLVKERLRYLEAAQARRDAWIAAHGGLAP
ncbi:MAG: hypothetical protein ACHQU1_11045 [Gemmatimonadales bacterium]